MLNRNYNPLHAAAEHGYYAYLSGKFNDWRGAFRHGTIATILTVLTVVTTAKGVSGAVKKGGVAGLGAAEEGAINGGLKPGDVMTYQRYLESRMPGSSLRGHHVPQQARLKESGINPANGTVVVMESADHAITRTYKGRGRAASAAESGTPLSHSEALDLADPPVMQFGSETAGRIRALNRENHPGKFQ